MDSDKYFEYLIDEAVKNAQSFEGWNFSYLTSTGRMVTSSLPWNYHDIVLPHLRKAKTMLDMGTGGGEVLAEFSPLPPATYATEQYKPNVEVAHKRLEPLGVKVIEIEEEKEPPFNSDLPFEDDYFDLIINRHEAYYPPELIRILKPGGIFITQQVGGSNMHDLVYFMTGEPVKMPNWNLESAVEELETAGFWITMQQEEAGYYRFFDIGVIVYLLLAVPWTVENFSVEEYRDKLWELHLKIGTDGYYESAMPRFIVTSMR
jgi:SAM-dependent methyltransferase